VGGLSSVDGLMLLVLAVSMLLGIWRGLVYEVLSVCGWVAAFVLAQLFAGDVAALLPVGGSDVLRYPLAFALVFVGVVFAAGFLAWLARKLVHASGISPADRALGGMFGALRAVVIGLSATALVSMTSFKEHEAWRQSVGAGVMTTALKGLKPVLPEQFGRYLPA
jgi:membrane protein required for colicin V production